MKSSQIHVAWEGRSADRDFPTAVSLHSHTVHSREYLDFIPRVSRHVPLLHFAVRQLEEQYRAREGRSFDYRRAWWTPPLSAGAAWELETTEVERTLGIRAMVSLTDHDTVEAPVLLRALYPERQAPISVEGSVPFGEAVFHLGVHNLPPEEAPAVMEAFSQYRQTPGAGLLAELLAWLDSLPEVLVVWNHPFWNEFEIDEDRFAYWQEQFLSLHRRRIHAVEWNGLRPWRENRLAARLSADCEIPLVSGGDRHGRRPNSVLNLTRAACFAEFVHEIRKDRRSDVLLMPYYREPFRVRLIQSICDVMCDDPGHGMGWRRWTDRVFYHCDDGKIRSLSELWRDGEPALPRCFAALIRLIDHHRLQPALRFAFPERAEEAAP